MYLSSVKLKDFHMFEDLPNVTLAETENETIQALKEVEKEYKRRKGLLFTIPELKRVADAKGVKKNFPHLYYEFQPIFFTIDEMARFSENEAIMDLVTEIAETAGYLGVHLIIASQRPDAQTVLNARIKANLLSRLAFTTSNTANSKIILDQEGAESLGGKQGRGLFVNGLSSIVQVPYMTDEVSLALLSPFYVEKESSDGNDENETRYVNPPMPKALQSAIEKSTSIPSLSGKH
jgi:S-DNA-T family DNA segregation ATPase FtsK/SpoIIIE